MALENLYFIALESQKRLQIQYIPDEIDINRTADVDRVKIIGRNNPKHHYTSGEKTLKMRLDFHAEREDRRDVIEKCEWLESLTYNEGMSAPPDRVRLVFGQLFVKNEVWVVLSVNYKLQLFNKAVGLLPQQAYVDLTLGLDNDRDFRKGDFI